MRRTISLAVKLLAVPALLTATLASSQVDDPTRLRAFAAGYKAQFICSGLFNGGKTLKQIERDELTGIYDEIARIVPELTADIDSAGKTVRVAFSDGMPPRTAIHNPATGCTSMPTGWIAKPMRQAPQPSRLAPGALDAERWPMGDMNVRRDAPPGMNAIERAIAPVFGDNAFGGKTSAILLVKGGQIVAEEYALGHDKHTSQRTWSVAKSMAATYVGYVKQMKHDARWVPPYTTLTNSADPRNDVTLNHYLRMASGMLSDTAGNRTDHVYMGGASVTQRALQWPLIRKPGVRFRYANNDSLIATLMAREAAPELHPHQLFDKLGMTRTFAETDWHGNYILSSQVWTTSRDLARMGLLYLKGGMWNGERLLPENWREYVSSPSGPQPEGRPFGYGAQFWLMNKSEGIPKDTFAGFGNRGQFLVIVPSMDMVIVRRGYDSRGNRFDIEAFTRAVVAAAKS